MSLPMLIWIAITEALCVNAGDGNKQLFKSFISKVDCLLRLVKHQMVSSRGREMFTKVYQRRLLKWKQPLDTNQKKLLPPRGFSVC